MKYLLILVLIILSFKNYSQVKEYQPKSVVRIISENDFWLFNHSDNFYTQGLKIEYLKDLPDKSKFSKWWPFLLKNKTQNIIGIGIGQNLYTSSDITIPAIMVNDRPYSAWLYISNSYISNNQDLDKRLTSYIYVGVIGPIAYGGEVQRTWHKIISSPDPKGWPYQIKNDFGINLNLKYEKGLISYLSKHLSFDFVSNIELQAGSVFNIAAIGSTTRLSILNSSSYF